MSNLIVATNFVTRNNQKRIGASVYERLNRKSEDDEEYYSIKLYEFDDNDSYSTFDSFLVQIGSCTLYISDEFDATITGSSTKVNDDTTNNIKKKRDHKKLLNIFHGKDIDLVFIKPSFLVKSNISNTNTVDLSSKILKLTGKPTHVTNSAEIEMPVAYGKFCRFITHVQML